MVSFSAMSPILFSLYLMQLTTIMGDLYSRKNVIGDHDIIRSATPAKMDTIKNKYYWPNNSLLTVADDVNHDDAFKQVEQILGGWRPSTFDPFRKWPIP